MLCYSLVSSLPCESLRFASCCPVPLLRSSSIRIVPHTGHSDFPGDQHKAFKLGNCNKFDGYMGIFVVFLSAKQKDPHLGTGEMAQGLRALAVLAEDPGSFPAHTL